MRENISRRRECSATIFLSVVASAEKNGDTIILLCLDASMIAHVRGGTARPAPAHVVDKFVVCSTALISFCEQFLDEACCCWRG
jgi:hypothetical protein